MGIIAWIVIGLLVGAIAKFIMPGKDPGGIVITMLIGIAGGPLGGWLGSVACALEPLRIAEHSTYEVVERVARSAVGGLHEAEAAARIPTGWTLRASQLGRKFARSLGASPTSA